MYPSVCRHAFHSCVDTPHEHEQPVVFWCFTYLLDDMAQLFGDVSIFRPRTVTTILCARLFCGYQVSHVSLQRSVCDVICQAHVCIQVFLQQACHVLPILACLFLLQ